jgi:predicted Zn-dependent peptidase
MTIIRSQPEIHEIEKFVLPSYERRSLDNGIPIYILQSNEPDIFKLEIIFKAGRFYEAEKAVSKITAGLLKEGSLNFTSAEIARRIDFLGASVITGSGMDYAFIQAHFLGKYFNELIGMISEFTFHPVFDERELSKFKNRQTERLKVELSKNEVLAYRYLTEHIYGKDHPYGYSTDIQDYNSVTRQQIVDHYTKYYNSEQCTIFITGNLNDERYRVINDTFGLMRKSDFSYSDLNYTTNKPELGKFIYENDRMFQSSIRLGKKIFNRHHSDYPALYLLNTILGGYFGARLSANIREDKGYTYGIYSALEMMEQDGYFLISTDVGNEYLELTLAEIYKELKILRDKKVPYKELKLVKNYIKGYMLSAINGNFNTLNLIKIIELAELRTDYFSKFIDKISSFTPANVLETANKYFTDDDLTVVLVGSKENQK